METIKNTIDFLNIAQWATALAFITGLWKFVLKSAFDTWWKNKLEQQKQEIGNALTLQKELTLKKAEFERVKLERVLPLLEAINGAISEHSLMFNTYTHAIANNMGYPEKLELMRLEQDKHMVAQLSKLSIYIPLEFRTLLYQIRRVISCSWKDAHIAASVLRACGSRSDIAFAAQELHSDLVECFYSMCNEYITSTTTPTTFNHILTSNNFDKNANTTKVDPTNQLAWKFLVLPEYYGSGEQVKAQNQYEEFFIKTSTQPSNPPLQTL